MLCVTGPFLCYNTTIEVERAKRSPQHEISCLSSLSPKSQSLYAYFCPLKQVGDRDAGSEGNGHVGRGEPDASNKENDKQIFSTFHVSDEENQLKACK